MNSPNNDISGLRDMLFKTLRGLQDGSIKPDLAKAINETGQTIINTAKVEVEFLKQTGSKSGTGFVPLPAPPAGQDDDAAKPTNTGMKLPTPDGYQHRMR